MSEAGRYTKLPSPKAPWRAAERRSSDPLNQLGRRLEPVCRAAVDPFEVAAYLESVGYNRYRVRQEFGLAGPFELAEHLYAQVPRRAPSDRLSADNAGFVWQRHLAILLTFIATLLLQSAAAPTGFEAVLWLIVWSVVGSGVVGHLSAETDDHQQTVIGALLGVGLAGLLVSVPVHQFSWAEVTVSLLWWNLTGDLWSAQVRAQDQGERSLLPCSLPLAGVGAVLVATLMGAPLPLWSSAAVALCTSLFGVARRHRRLDLDAWRHLVTPPRQLLLLALYGGGQGFLLVSLLQTESDYLLLGTVLLAAVLVGLEWAANGLAHVLARALWSSTTLHGYQRRARRATTLWLLVLLLPVLFIATHEGQLPYGAAVYSFLLLGLGLGLGLTLLNLTNLSLPSFAFALTAAAVLLGFPLVNALALLVTCLSLGLLLHLRELESYGVQVL